MKNFRLKINITEKSVEMNDENYTKLIKLLVHGFDINSIDKDTIGIYSPEFNVVQELIIISGFLNKELVGLINAKISITKFCEIYSISTLITEDNLDEAIEILDGHGWDSVLLGAGE